MTDLDRWVLVGICVTALITIAGIVAVFATSAPNWLICAATGAALVAWVLIFRIYANKIVR